MTAERSRKRRGASRRTLQAAANFRRVVAMVKRNMRSLERRMRTPPRPRKIDPEVAKRAYEHALKLISMEGADAVLFLRERDRFTREGGEVMGVANTK
jgi:hypothetical protein